jgi:predicted TIM-barrel fold metal-dependent hydrolase
MSRHPIGRRSFLKGAGATAFTAAAALQLKGIDAQEAVPNSSGTERPKLKAPAGACDCHHHIYDAVRFAPPAKAPAAIQPNARVEDYRLLQRRIGTTRNVVVTPAAYVTDNRVTLDAIARSGGKYRGTAIIDASYTEKQFREMHEGGIRGVRFNFVKHLGGRPDMALFDRTVARLREMGWHLILHLDSADLVEFRRKFEAIPVPMVIDHMGRVKAAEGLQQEPFRVLLDFMKNDNFWVKICGAERVSSKGPPFDDALPFARALIEAAPGRILWGTDWPHPNVGQHMPNDGDLVDLFARMAPEPVLQRKILVDNPARLYGFEEIK